MAVKLAERNTVLRSMHDIGLAEWFGGSLMGVIGLNGAAANVPDRTERLRVASIGWDRWTPMNAAAIGAHLIGSAGILANERRRVTGQKGVGAMSATKTGLTAAALGATAYSRMLGRKLEKAGRVPVEGVTEPAPDTPSEIRQAQRRQKIAQWAVPLLTGAVIVISAFAGEQQKPGSVARGIMSRLGDLVTPD
ncbi:hypothetical protein HC031_02100 [Planosporangium thailandense]|uniref:DUF4235 domain-containing protein n=1 Tax=Planosporangium thailandense TaxID=765197 RepID=A0ABX0XR94_9ACTN|nr:hypothetical protein [Planosporangium thailandense]NJC68520.1 hypothetical protein [Planosporangium thailandense]